MIKVKLHQNNCCKENTLRPTWIVEYVDGEKFRWCRYHWTGKKLREKKVEMKPEQDKLDMWYHKIFEIAEGRCAETGNPLKFDKKLCCHLLPKKDGTGGFPYFKFDLRNGLLLSWRFHDIIDHGSPSQRKALKTWEYISDMRKLLLSEVGMEYNEEFWLSMKT